MKKINLSSKKYDVVIVGAGTAGLAARSEVKKHTDSYLVIDNGPLGTTCARVGCMPSKVFIEAANAFYQSTKYTQIGVSGAELLKVDTVKLMEHVRALRDRFVRGVLRDIEEWKDTHFYEGRAKLLGPHLLEVNGQRVEANKIILATGSSTSIPEMWRPLSHKFLTSDNFFEIKQLPKSMAVIGAGVIGLELAQAAAKIGTKVTLFGFGSSIAGITDLEILESIRVKLNQEMSLVEEPVETFEEQGDGFVVKTKTNSYSVDQVLVAVGRKPNISQLGLENLGVKLDQRGLPSIDPKTCRIEGTDVYMAGDAHSYLPLLHEASDEGRIAGFNAVRPEDHKFTRRIKMTITFSHPNISVVGLSWKGLEASGTAFASGKVNFEKQGRALAKMDNYGLLKVFADQKSGLLLGAEIFAPEGEHLAHILASAIESKLTVAELLTRPFYHPVIEEGLRTALRDLSRQVGQKCSEFDLLRCEDPAAGSFV
ncbi:Dihydrolipoyl dehydrogenase [compost metagenome]